MRSVLTFLAVVAGLLVIVAGGAMYGISRYNAPGPLAVARPLVIMHGSPEAVADQLAETGVIDAVMPFRVATLVTSGKGPLHAGEYTFPQHASLSDVLVILRSGKPVQHKLTIPEGLTAFQIARIFERAPALDGEIPKLGEGEVLPQTYAYTFGTSRLTMLDRARAAMNRALAQAWDARAENLPLATPREMLTLASIVERETARPEERAHIAAVFLNRLAKRMRLQSDPTVAYAVSNGQATADKSLTKADLDTNNPYNTYVIPALPPGPIDSPGLASLQAVARPLVSDDIYFVADGTGGHVFAATLEEHNRNVAKFRLQTH